MDPNKKKKHIGQPSTFRVTIFPSCKIYINKITVYKFDISSKLYRVSFTLELRTGIILSSSSTLVELQLDLIDALIHTHLCKMSSRLLSTKTANNQLLLVILQLFSDTFSLSTNHHRQQHLAILSLNYTAAGILLLASQKVVKMMLR